MPDYLFVWGMLVKVEICVKNEDILVILIAAFLVSFFSPIKNAKLIGD